jgi:hypothetical protein
MNDENIEKLINTDRHGVYKKQSGEMVLLPIRRHYDWIRKNMTFICDAKNVEDEKVKKIAAEKEEEYLKKKEQIIKKYGEEIINDLPEFFGNHKLSKFGKKVKNSE